MDSSRKKLSEIKIKVWKIPSKAILSKLLSTECQPFTSGLAILNDTFLQPVAH